MKAFVVAGGDAVADDAALLADADLVIAADSGAHWLDAQGRRPDRVVGDMDSVAPALLELLAADGVMIERHPVEKDASDLELAVGRAVDLGATEVVILGALGGRLDHEVANLLLLARPAWRGVGLSVVRGNATARLLLAGDRLRLEGAVGDLVTLLPLGGDATDVRTDGLRYPLGGEALKVGSSLGLSNVVIHSPARVSLGGGTLLVIEITEETGS